jgi:hypothetical protein
LLSVLFLLEFIVLYFSLVCLDLLLLLKNHVLLFSYPLFKLNFLRLFLFFNFFSHLLTLLKTSLQLLKLLLFLLHNSFSLLSNFFLLFLIQFLFDLFFLEIQLILSKIPVNILLINIFSRLSVRNNNKEHIVSSKTDPIKMEYFLFFTYHVSIEITSWLLSIKYRIHQKVILRSSDDSLKLSDTHSTYFNIILDLSSSLSYFCLRLFNCVVDFSTQLRILIQVSYMRLWKINFIEWFYLCLCLFPLSLCHLKLLFFFRYKLQLSLSLHFLFNLFRWKWKFLKHLLHLYQFIPQFFSLLSQSSN